MKPKVLFVVVGLLAACFVAGVSVGLFREDGTGDLSAPGWAEPLRGFLEEPLEVGDVAAAFPDACLLQMQRGTFVLGPGETCTLVIDEATARVRVLNLELAAGADARVVFDPLEEDHLTARESLTPGERSTEVRIFGEGGTLALGCLLAPDGECRIAVAGNR